MERSDLFELVTRAKSGDKTALEEIITLFRPAIQRASKRAKPQERNDLEQHMSEKIIRAVYAYDLDSVPDYSRFVAIISRSE
ncbi:helix-turn-helix domain-containing protein [Paenibacillus sp. P26]|nr:helix-turn-helix domain-containing protein [Paenibacillus sp. P26]UUZ90349.1 helix-turn-helix domain-containing protein [Paenibacillus sp. P25]